jgi:iron(III) transport system permease protein
MTTTPRMTTTAVTTETAPAPTAMPARGARAKRLHVWLSAGLYAFFAVFLLWPILQVIAGGFFRSDGRPTLGFVALVFQDPVLRHGLLNATTVAVLVTLGSLLIALPLAVLSVRYDFPGRRIFSGLLLVPLVLPPFVGAIGIRLILGRFGPATQVFGSPALGIDWLGKYRLAGIVIVEVLHLYPVLLLNLQAALANVDPAMEQSAANLGAGRWTVLRTVTLPLVRPGLFAGLTLVLIWSFTELGTPLMFGYYDVTPVQVFHLLTDVATSPVPFALVVVMLVVSVLLYVIGKVILGRSFDAATTKASTAGTTKRLRGGAAASAAAFFAAVVGLAILPHVAVLLTSLTATGAWYKELLPSGWTLNHYAQALVDELAFPSIRNSLVYASLATVIAAGVGLAAAVVIVRSNVRGRGLIDALCMLPLAVPGLVLAFGYLAISIDLKRRLGARTPFWLDVQTWPVAFLVIAYAARRLPYVVRSAAAGLQQTPRDLELAASNLGAGRSTVLLRITIPLILANLIAGALLAFAFAMLEVSDSLVLAQRTDYYPITKAILDLSQRLGDGPYIAAALGVWAMLLLTLTILAANALLGRKMGTIFRV